MLKLIHIFFTWTIDGVNAGAVGDERSEDLLVSVEGGQVNGRLAVVVASGQIAVTAGQQLGHHVQLSVGGRTMQKILTEK